MNRQQVAELTEDFFKSSVVVNTPIDTSRAVIPAPRSIDQIIADEVSYHTSTMTVQLRTELRGEIEKVKDELAAMRAERKVMSAQHAELSRECAEVRNARERLAHELAETQRVRAQTYELYNRVCAAICTPSRQQITGR